MIAVLAPAALALSALAAVPIVVHLLTRQRVQDRSFPMLAFLAQVEAGRARRSRLRDRLVLILRALALLAGALAVAGLAWRGSLAGHGGRPAVILLDGSASMRQVVDGATVFSRARAAASRLLAESGGRPMTLLVTGTGGGSAVTGHGAIASRLAEAEPGFGDGDPAGALTAAIALLKDGGDCFFITDLARGSLAGVDPQAVPAGVGLHLVDAGGGGDNRALIGLAAEPGIAVAGRPVTVSARVANYSATAQQLTIDLRIGPHGLLLPIDLPAGSVGTVSHTVTFDAAGTVAVSAELSGDGTDALRDDDRRNGRLDIVPAIATTLVTDADRYDQVGAVRPLIAALDAAGLTPRVSDAAGFAGDVAATGSGVPALLVTVALRTSEGVAPAIKAHLERGGAWLHVVVSAADVALATNVGVAAPAELGARVDISEQERGAMAVAQARLDHALLQPFQGREALLRSIAAYRYHLTPRGPAADAAVLWAYGDGTIALSERPVGAGRWLLLNCSPAALDSNLARGEVLPLLLARLPAALLPARNERLTRDVGSDVAASAPLIADDGRALPVNAGRVRLDRPGLYRAASGALEAAAVPALESDLRQLDPALLKLHAVSAERIADAATVTPLWPWLLALVALALAVESLVAGGLGRSRSAVAGTVR